RGLDAGRADRPAGFARACGAATAAIEPVLMAQAVLALACRTVRLAGPTDFDGWRKAARRLVLEGVSPSDIAWIVDAGAPADDQPPPAPDPGFTVPRDFVEKAKAAICHSDPERFALLYRILFRLRGEP